MQGSDCALIDGDKKIALFRIPGQHRNRKLYLLHIGPEEGRLSSDSKIARKIFPTIL